jgi:hypothetical protein
VTPPGPAEAGLRLRIADPLAEHDAAATAARLPGAGIFHTQAWARTLDAAYGFRTRLFLAETAGGALAAAAAVTAVQNWPRGLRGVSQPFADECPIVHRDTAARDFLYRAVGRHAVTSGWRHWELRGAGAPPGTAAATVFHGHEFPLDSADRDCPAAAAPCVHRAVRLAMRAGVSVALDAGESALRRFHSLYCRTRRRHGAPPAPWAFFAALGRELISPGHGFVALATRGGEDLAGAVFLLHEGRAHYKYGASDPERHHLRPNHLVMARSAAWCARQGCTTLDLGRTSLGAAGLRRYKLSWGAAERPVTYTRLHSRSGRQLHAADPAGAWPSTVLRRLPLPLLRALGAWLHPRFT